MTGPLTYPVATLEKSHARLTVAEHYTDPSTPIRAAGWGYVNTRTRDKSPVRETHTLGSVREVLGNWHPDRDQRRVMRMNRQEAIDAGANQSRWVSPRRRRRVLSLALSRGDQR
jgi:hypothetical protein